MNSENFTVFLSMKNILRKITLYFDYYNESISAEIEDKTFDGTSGIIPGVEDFYEKGNPVAEKKIERIIIPERLMNAAVFGISEEGSTRSAKRLAWSKLLNVKHSYSASDTLSTVDLKDIDYIIIAGGYDNSVNNRLNSMLLSIGKNLQLLETKPEIIFAGSRLSLETARKELAKPGIRFTSRGNVLEASSYAEDEELLQQNTINSIQQLTLWDEIEDVKTNDIAYTEALRKVSDVFCMKRSETVLSVLFTGDYTLLSHAERGAGTTFFRNYAVPQEADTLTREVFESVFNDLFIEKPRTERYLTRRLFFNENIQYARRAAHNMLEVGRIVVFQGTVNAEASPQRRGKKTLAGSGADQRKGSQINAHRTRTRSLIYHNINHIVLHCRVKIFLHFGRKTVNFIDKQHISLFQGSEQTRQITRAVQHRTGGNLHIHPHLIGDDMCKGSLSQTRRAVEQRMIQGFSAHLGRLNINIQVLDDFLLAGEIFQLLRADNSVQFLIFAVRSVAGIKICHLQRSGVTDYKYNSFSFKKDDFYIGVEMLITKPTNSISIQYKG